MLGEQFGPYDQTAVTFRATEMRSTEDTVGDVLAFFDERQQLFSPQPIPARDVFVQRLETLRSGQPIEVVCFNCIDFTYKPKGGNYPQATALDDTDSALVACYQKELSDAVGQLRRLGDPKVTIIVPDSELTDTNVFNFSQRDNERSAIGQRLQAGLSEQFADTGVSVMLWSDFLASRGLPSPETYTARNLPLVMGPYRKSVKDMVASSTAYFSGKGIGEAEIGKVSPAELAIRSAWYLAMYAGEGNALGDLGNGVMLNFENDPKVLRWSQRGAQGLTTDREVLPIITPADTRKFKPWKEGLSAQTIGVVRRRIRV